MSGVAGPDATVRITDAGEAGGVYGRGYFGTTSDDGLRLDAYESVYLREMDRLDVVDARGRPIDWSELFLRASRAVDGFNVRYIVYRDLRQRGYVVRASPPPVAFAVLPRGGILHKTPSRYWVQPFSERVPFRLAELRELAERAQSAKKNLLIGVIDEESDLTYYRVRRPTPSGALVAPRPPEGAIGWLTEDRVVVFDAGAVGSFGGSLSFGSRIGNRLDLSLLEASYLAATGSLKIRDARSRRTVPLERLLARARRLDGELDERLAAYRALRDRNLIVKTGFKYGAHFRAYPRHPEHSHARYLLQAVPDEYEAPWPEIAGAIRVAQGVRKEFLFAAVGAKGVGFVSLERIRP